MTMTQTALQELLNKGGTVILPEGTYRFSDLVIPAGAVLQGQGSVIFEGSRIIPAMAWQASGSLRYTEYVPIPVRDGHGISFSSGQGLVDPLGKHADQVWTRAEGDTRLRRVPKSKVTRGTFAVEGNTLWVHEDDHAAGILVSDKRVAIKSLRGILRGVSIKRYSPTAGDGAAVNMTGGTLESCVIDACSFAAVAVTGTDPKILRTSISRAGWMGIAARQATNLLLDGCSFNRINDFGYFATNLQSGALKTSRCRQVTVLNTVVASTTGNALWFDQSTSDVTVSDSEIVAKGGSGIFFEISHGMTVVDCRVSAEQDGIKVAGASGVVIVGNDITGGRHAVGIWTDKRSVPGWSDPRNPVTTAMKAAGVYASDRRSLAWRDPRITWLPRVEVLEHNILHRPVSGKPAVYVLTSNGSASFTKAQIVPLGHQ